MQETKTITLQELSAILRQYSRLDVGTFSPSGNCCLTANFQLARMKYGTKANGVPYLHVYGDTCFLALDGPTVQIIYDSYSTDTYMAFVIVADSVHYNITVYK